jgi:hypothetical protein
MSCKELKVPKTLSSGCHICGNPEGVAFVQDWLSDWRDTTFWKQQKKLFDNRIFALFLGL